MLLGALVGEKENRHLRADGLHLLRRDSPFLTWKPVSRITTSAFTSGLFSGKVSRQWQ